MAADLPETITSLLTEALPGLFGGTKPVIRAAFASDALALNPATSEASASDPRPADQVDELAFDGEGPYQLTRSPYPGPRRVRLRTAGGAISLSDAEVRWDIADPRSFTLSPRPSRDLDAVTAVEVRYGVTAVFTTLGATRSLALSLQADEADAWRLGEAVALLLAAIELNRDALAAAAPHYHDGEYGALAQYRRLRIVGATAPTPTTWLVTLEADALLRLDRSLREDEGAPITHIASPGRAPRPGRPVDIAIEVDA
ncbi:hypothetical protein OM076_41550 [Solirubrobacter ginsenosidimutans]|uniref:Uncharacterized protein n=1 Tax=Solirubrobacter ginsenosidimutans TaxID=490573 RepID=A0A9X3N4F1_9ACTN|nr:hypothetical protein [Solirubrobacter ginsenosidimutans]MDA0166820.1 hypothetical protein [Solirubrobacter ginsenosidimutans]